MHQRPLPIPTYDAAGNQFVPPDGLDYAEPILGFARVGYENGAEGVFVPRSGRTEFEVHGSEGRAVAWDDGDDFFVRRRGAAVEEARIRPAGESPTVVTVREIVRELETGERTSGNIDVTLQALEAEFGAAYSHVQGGARIDHPYFSIDTKNCATRGQWDWGVAEGRNTGPSS